MTCHDMFSSTSSAVGPSWPTPDLPEPGAPTAALTTGLLNSAFTPKSGETTDDQPADDGTARELEAVPEVRGYGPGAPADMCDAEQELPRPIVKDLADEGWISSLLPEDWGGSARDTVTYGLMSEEMGRACSTVRNFVAVEDMVSHSIWKWGTPAQRARWLPAVAAGEAVLAFALTEPGVGSDAKSVTTEARPDGPDLVLNGVKEWISFGQLADGFLVFTQYEGHHTAFLVDRDSPGIYVEPLRNLLGLRGSMLARITFDECRIPSDAMVGRPGSGLAFVASSALDIGRYSTAWGAWDSPRRASTRRPGTPRSARSTTA
ncbi:acyl-CoA dehydrogenase family protein [Streptomyces sp. FXJ1.4098]|nr:acyl-CoA dehydrogenase family protein [Streptomyces sp. FXJ1.4098]